MPMTKEEQRIVCAELQGWKFVETGPKGKTWCPPKGQPIVHTLAKDLSNYPEDLNAMHEVEKTLTLESSDIGKYLYQLEKVCVVSGDEGRNKLQQFKYVTATASQRLEAYLRLKGKWKE